MLDIVNILLKNRKSFPIRADGISMVPLLQSGDILYLRKTPFSKVKINDLVTVEKGKNVFTHRVIYKTQGLVLFPPPRRSASHTSEVSYLITKGDNNISSDGKIYPNQLIGKVEEVKRKGQMINLGNYYLFQSSLYFAEITKIKKAFENGKIDFVFLKGLPLHLYFEKSHPRRIYADCDVLIDIANLNIVENILVKNGYKKYETSYSKIHKILKDKPTELTFAKVINNYKVIFDVHFEINFLMNQLGKVNELYSQDLIDKLTGACIDSNKSVLVNHEKFLILNSEFLILYLALHFFHHNFRGTFRLEFLDKVIMSSTPGVFLSISNNITKYKLQNFIYPVFLLLKKYYSTPLPKTFLPSIKPNSSVMNYINKNIVRVRPSVNLRSDPICIFDDEPRIAAGITRFRNLFFLSPNPLWKKLMIIFNLQVIYSVFWVMIFFARRLAKRYFR